VEDDVTTQIRDRKLDDCNKEDYSAICDKLEFAETFPFKDQFQTLTFDIP
jgi:hypothetical protein